MQNGCTLPLLIFSNFCNIGLLENILALRGVRRSLPDRSEPGNSARKKLAVAPPFMLSRALWVDAAEREEAVARGGGDVLVQCLAILFPTRRRMFSRAVLL